jgi:DNA ligase D-like protein (predicted polymerase)/DNA ligase D-like protein (predicted 3'-phosphoesterase)
VSLKEYQDKRRFARTPEPKGKLKKTKSGPLRFVVQMHAATRLHYDLRIEMGGVFKSWAVPKGPSLNTLDQRLAVKVEDHPLEYGDFEGIIPPRNYGAGTVMIWDAGTLTERGSSNRAEGEKALLKGLEKGHITFVLQGHKLRGEFALVQLKKKGGDKNWLLLKKRDAFASYKDITKEDRSVLSGRSIEEIAREAKSQGDMWLPGKGRAGKSPRRKVPAAPKLEEPTKLRKVPSLPAEKSGALENEKIPHRLKPMLASVGGEAFDDPQWIFEACPEGHRAIAVVQKGKVDLYSKQRLSFATKFPEIVAALRKISGDFVLDGEIDSQGQCFYAQDLLHLNGKSWRKKSLRERKDELRKLKLEGPRIRVNAFVYGKGSSFARAQAKLGQRFIYAKEASSHYHSGVHAAWLKIEISPSGKPERKVDTTLTNLGKIYWPQEGYTKGDLVEYYRSVSSYILPHLKDRPQSLHRFPDGISSKGFFHKDMTGYLPKFLSTESIYSESSSKSVNYALCQNEASLLYLANLGCIELNPWSSRVGSLDEPDFAIIDLDPDDNDFADVVKVAKSFQKILERLKIQAFCKTSGATGLHICVPLARGYTYEDARLWAQGICEEVYKLFPKLTSLERSPAKRRGKIYLDFLQNRRGATLAAPYCVRPRPLATVSAPLKWTELTSSLRPEQFTIKNMLSRLQKVGDLWKEMLKVRNKISR